MSPEAPGAIRYGMAPYVSCRSSSFTVFYRTRLDPAAPGYIRYYSLWHQELLVPWRIRTSVALATVLVVSLRYS